MPNQLIPSAIPPAQDNQPPLDIVLRDDRFARMVTRFRDYLESRHQIPLTDAAGRQALRTAFVDCIPDPQASPLTLVLRRKPYSKMARHLAAHLLEQHQAVLRHQHSRLALAQAIGIKMPFLDRLLKDKEVELDWVPRRQRTARPLHPSFPSSRTPTSVPSIALTEESFFAMADRLRKHLRQNDRLSLDPPHASAALVAALNANGPQTIGLDPDTFDQMTRRLLTHLHNQHGASLGHLLCRYALTIALDLTDSDLDAILQGNHAGNGANSRGHLTQPHRSPRNGGQAPSPKEN